MSALKIWVLLVGLLLVGRTDGRACGEETGLSLTTQPTTGPNCLEGTSIYRTFTITPPLPYDDYIKCCPEYNASYPYKLSDEDYLANYQAFAQFEGNLWVAMTLQPDGSFQHFDGTTYTSRPTIDPYLSSLGQVTETTCLEFPKDGTAVLQADCELSTFRGICWSYPT